MNIYTNITPISSSSTPVSDASTSSVIESNTITNISGSITDVQKPKKTYPNLKPFKKGQSGNPKGKSKGCISIKEHVNKLLTKEDAQAIARSIINGSISGDDSKQDRLLKLNGELNTTQNTQNTHYNILIGPEIISAARAYLSTNPNNMPIASIVDIDTPTTGSSIIP